MYVHREIEKNLLEWKQKYYHYVLKVEGCRQIGKTTTVRRFAKENYDNVIYVNASIDPIELLAQMNENNAVEVMTSFCKTIGYTFNNTRDTVLIIDEIQESRALYERIRLLKDSLNCDVIITGSYLAKAKSFFQPAGDVYRVRMHPLSYREYVEYYGAGEYYDQTALGEMDDSKKKWFKNLYNFYLTIGGYPAAFVAFTERGDLYEVFESLLDSFKSEFRVNTGNPADYDKIDVMFETICKVLCREKKGESHLTNVASQITAQCNSKRISNQECDNLLSWLSAARIINYCDKLDLATGELYPSERFYFEDVGLFNYLCDKYYIEHRTKRGLLAETFLFKQLAENDYSKRFYGSRPAFAVCNGYELDFCVRSRNDDSLYGIEVKAGKGSGVSLKKMLEDRKLDFGVYAKGDSEYSRQNSVIPLYQFSKFGFNLGKPVQKEEIPQIQSWGEMECFKNF